MSGKKVSGALNQKKSAAAIQAADRHRIAKQGARIRAVTAKQKPVALVFDDIDCAFSEAFKSPPTSFYQRLQFSLVTLLFFCFPVVYLSLISLVAYFTFSYAYSLWSQPGNIWFESLLYTLPVMLGILATIFLLRPLLPKLKYITDTPFPLDVDSEPVLAHLVKRLCTHMGIQEPAAINISMAPVSKISVSGVRKFFLSEYELNIGMPLITCLSAKQFVAILARELSYTTNKLSLYCYVVAQTVMKWLDDYASNRDGWQEWFASLEIKSPIPIAGFIGVVGRAGIYTTNKLLGILLNLGQRVSLPALRTIELKADQCQASIAGSRVFADSLVKLQRIKVALAISEQQNFSHNSKSLVEDFARLVQANYTNMSNSEMQKVKAEVLRLQTDCQAVLPSNADRIYWIKLLDVRASFTLKRPASALLADMDNLAKEITLHFYRQCNYPFDLEKLVPVAGRIEQINRDCVQTAELENYTLGWFMPNFVWDVPSITRIDHLSKKEKIELIEQAIVALRRHIPELNSCREEHQCLMEKLIQAESEQLISKLKDKSYRKKTNENNHDILQKKCRDSIATYDECFGNRVVVAVSLLENATIKQKMFRLLEHLKKLKEVELSVTEGQIKKSVLKNLMALKDVEDQSSYNVKIRSLAQGLAISSDDLRFHMKDIPVSLLNDSSFFEVVKKPTANLIGPIDDIHEAAMDVVEDFEQLLACFSAFNQAMSLRLIKISAHIEKKYKIQPVRLLKRVKSSDAHAA